MVPLTSLLKLVNIGTFTAFVIVCAGVMVLRFTHPHVQRPFRVPLGPGSFRRPGSRCARGSPSKGSTG